jgi:signal transduction histidine kinase
VWWAAGTAGATLWLAAVWEPTGAQRLTEVGAETLWLALIFAAARAYRNRQGWQAETAARLAHQERLLMARELHDVVAHTLTVVGVQLHVANEALEDSPDEAREALRVAQDVRAKAVADLRDFLDLLRSGPSLTPTGDVRAVVALFNGAHLSIEGDENSVPAPVGLAVFRLVQEALTNAVKHAQADRIDVRLRYRSSQVDVDISDDGRGPSRWTGGLPNGPGHGLAGMRERVAALGGTFHAGPGPQGGFQVSAVIPMGNS